VKLKFTDIFLRCKKTCGRTLYVRQPICAKIFGTEAKMIFFHCGEKAKILISRKRLYPRKVMNISFSKSLGKQKFECGNVSYVSFRRYFRQTIGYRANILSYFKDTQTDEQQKI
jgi:hypothetical protein